MVFALRFAVLCVSLIGIFGCSHRATLWLLDVSSLESSTAERGSTLELSGHAFPAGRQGELLLIGQLRTPGESPKQVAYSLRALAASSTRVTAYVDARTAESVGPHATFEGRAQLRFGQDHGPWVAGEVRDVVLEWLGNEDANDARLRREGQRVAESLGLELAEPATETGSVRVAGVHADSAADAARIVIGERIVSVNGLHVRSLADLAQPSAARNIRLVLRDAVDAQRTLDVELPRSSMVMLEGHRYLFWVCPVLVALLFLGPWVGPGEVLRFAIRRVRRERFSIFRSFGSSGLRPLATVALWTAPCAAASCLAAWTGSGLTLWAALVIYVALLVLRTARLEPTPETADIADRHERRAEELRQKFRFFGRGVLVSAVLASSGALAGSSSLAMLASEQGAVPWGWSIFARVPTWLAAAILVARTGRIHSAAHGDPLEVVLDNLGRIVLGVAITAVWFGGGHIGDHGLWPALDLGLSSATFAVKLFVVLCALAFAQPYTALTSLQLRRWCGAYVALIVAWAWIAPERTLELRVGSAVLISVLLTAALAALEYLAQRRLANPARA